MNPIPVILKESSGCGIPCVAMLADKSDEKTQSTANRLGIYAEDEKTLVRHRSCQKAAE